MSRAEHQMAAATATTYEAPQTPHHPMPTHAIATVAARRRGLAATGASPLLTGTAWRCGKQGALTAAVLAAVAVAACVAFLHLASHRRMDALPQHLQPLHPIGLTAALLARVTHASFQQAPAIQGAGLQSINCDGSRREGGSASVKSGNSSTSHTRQNESLAGGRERGEEDGEGEYLLVQLAGGLNQMRSGICDAVVVAKLLGATLVLPRLDNSSWWADGSTFSDVFDAPHFIRMLAPSVRVVPQLPTVLRDLPPVERTVPKASSPDYYTHHVRPLIRRAQVLKLNSFKFRLTDDLPAPLHKLRCQANYEALRFVPPVTRAVARLTSALAHPSPLATSAAIDSATPAAALAGPAGAPASAGSPHPAAAAGAAAAAAAGAAAAAAAGAAASADVAADAEGGGGGEGAPKYVALHLRYEPDMLAFTGCDYGGGARERRLFERIRKRWPYLPRMNPKLQRAKGKCLLTPSQVARALQALGFPPSTRLYIASGDLYGGRSALIPLLNAFPLATDKHSLAHAGGTDGKGGGDGDMAGAMGGGGALEGVEGRKTLLAAVDYEMCRRGEMLVLNNNGNMAHMLAAHRRHDGVGSTVQLFGSSILRLHKPSSKAMPSALASLIREIRAWKRPK